MLGKHCFFLSGQRCHAMSSVGVEQPTLGCIHAKIKSQLQSVCSCQLCQSCCCNGDYALKHVVNSLPETQMHHQTWEPHNTPTRKPILRRRATEKFVGKMLASGYLLSSLVKNGPSSRGQRVDEGYKWSCAPRPEHLVSKAPKRLAQDESLRKHQQPTAERTTPSTGQLWI